MRVWTTVVMVWSDELRQYVTDASRSESFDYEGPVALCGGGPSNEAKTAAASQARLTDATAKIATDNNQLVKDQFAKISPYATSRLNNGLPFYNSLTDFSAGKNAQAYAPAQAQLRRNLARMGTLPSGFAADAMSNLESERAHAFDNDLVGNALTNEQSKSEAARVLTNQQQVANPLGYTSTAMSGNQSLMNAPLQKPGIGGLLGGMAGGAAGAF